VASVGPLAAKFNPRARHSTGDDAGANAYGKHGFPP